MTVHGEIFWSHTCDFHHNYNKKHSRAPILLSQPPDVNTSGGLYSEVNKFEQVSSVGHKMALARGQGWDPTQNDAGDPV